MAALKGELIRKVPLVITNKIKYNQKRHTFLKDTLSIL